MLRWLAGNGACNDGSCPMLWGAENGDYTDAGQFIGAELLPEDRLDEYRQYREIALAHALPFGEYSAP